MVEKLTEQDITLIRKLYGYGARSSDLARSFGVTRQRIFQLTSDIEPDTNGHDIKQISATDLLFELVPELVNTAQMSAECIASYLSNLELVLPQWAINIGYEIAKDAKARVK